MSTLKTQKSLELSLIKGAQSRYFVHIRKKLFKLKESLQ